MTRVLIIDDEDMVRATLRLTLEDEGYEVSEATDGNDGLRKVADFDPDLVITDIFMPDKEGLETIIDIRRQRPDLKILAISDGGRMQNYDTLKYAKRLGADRVQRKPFDSDKILEIVAQMVGPAS